MPNSINKNCDICIKEITERADNSIKLFETKSESLINTFIKDTSEMFKHLKDESAIYFEIREKKSDEFYDRQEQRYEKLESKLISMVKYTLGVVLFVIAGYGSVLFLLNDQVQGKADKKDYLSIEDAKTLIDLGDKYRDQRYILRPGETIDKYNYQWFVETVFSRATRSGKEKK